MESKFASYFTGLIILCVMSLAAVQVSAQVSRASIESQIDQLVRESEKDGTGPSFVRLVEIGKPAIGPLLERLKKTKFCDFQYEAARVIWRIEPKHEILNQLLFDTARAKCEYRYPPEKYLPHVNMSSIMAQWYAAKSLAEYQEGGIVLAAQLPELNAVHSFLYAYPAIEEVLMKYEGGELPTDPVIIRCPRACDTSPGESARRNGVTYAMRSVGYSYLLSETEEQGTECRGWSSPPREGESRL